jgi:hypothetical protein
MSCLITQKVNVPFLVTDSMKDMSCGVQMKPGFCRCVYGAGTTRNGEASRALQQVELPRTAKRGRGRRV